MLNFIPGIVQLVTSIVKQTYKCIFYEKFTFSMSIQVTMYQMYVCTAVV